MDAFLRTTRTPSHCPSARHPKRLWLRVDARATCCPQDMMDAKMEKRRKGVFGPPAGKQFVVHIDDLNMPKQ